jgi:hypothetical protein
MRTGRPKVVLILADDERRRLESLAQRSRSAPHLARRVRIILTCTDGRDSRVVAQPQQRARNRAVAGSRQAPRQYVLMARDVTASIQTGRL